MLKIYIGPMYSGKTTELIRNYNRYKKYKQLIIDFDTNEAISVIKKNKSIENIDNFQFELESNNNYYFDTLYNHNNQQITSLKIKNINILEDLFIQKSPLIQEIKFIHINEAQFFIDLKPVVLNLIEKYNINVYLYGLDGDFKREKFGEIIDLIPYSDSITKLKGVCHNCDNDALFSHRICNGEEQMLINDSNENKYIPLCRKCYISVNKYIMKS